MEDLKVTWGVGREWERGSRGGSRVIAHPLIPVGDVCMTFDRPGDVCMTFDRPGERDKEAEIEERSVSIISNLMQVGGYWAASSQVPF